MAGPIKTRLDIASSEGERFDRIDALFAAIALVLTLFALRHLHANLYLDNLDIAVFYQPWYEHIVRYGRWASLEGSYANYSPPYLYILSFVSIFAGHIPPLVMVKLAQVPGLLVGAWIVWSICRKLGCSQVRSLIAAWLLLVAPEVLWNTLIWGQCDMLHTACLLGMVRLLLARRPAWAMLMFGVALAFKLQAIFVGAAVVALFLSQEVPLWSALCVPLGYAVMMVPAWMAGRPWRQLLLIYQSQYQSQPEISRDAANPYQLIYHWTLRHHLSYILILRAGFLVALVATICLIEFLFRSPYRLTGKRLVLAFAFTLLMEPFLLPKMHDRYFFSGDILVLLLAMVAPELIIPAAMLDIAAVMSYYPFLFGQIKDEPDMYYALPAALVLASLVWLGYAIAKSNDPQNEPTGVISGAHSD